MKTHFSIFYLHKNKNKIEGKKKPKGNHKKERISEFLCKKERISEW